MASRVPEGSMGKQPIVAEIKDLVARAGKANAGGAASKLVFDLLNSSLDRGDPLRDISDQAKESYGIDLGEKRVAEYGRWYRSQRSESPAGAGEMAEATLGSDKPQQAASSPPAEPAPAAANAGRVESTRARIIAALLAKIDGMVEDVIKDPASETTKLVKCLLLTQMVTEGTRLKDVEALFEQERRREQLEKELEIKRAELKQKDRSLRITLKRMGGVKEITDKARKAAENHKPFNYDRALKQISAVIGVGRPLVEYDAPQAQA